MDLNNKLSSVKHATMQTRFGYMDISGLPESDLASVLNLVLSVCERSLNGL